MSPRRLDPELLDLFEAQPHARLTITYHLQVARAKKPQCPGNFDDGSFLLPHEQIHILIDRGNKVCLVPE